MNSIQKALEEQLIYVAWNGALPVNSMVITETYLDGSVNGYPRLVRTDQDTGIAVDIVQLQIDYDAFHEVDIENTRIIDIKRIAGEIIYAKYSDVKQRNLTARGLELARAEFLGVLTEAEDTELDGIQAVWDWVKSIRSASNDAENNGTLAHLVDWPGNT